jgi:hypothetical protein
LLAKSGSGGLNQRTPDVPIYHKRPAFAFFVRESAASKQNITAEVRGFRYQGFVWGPSFLAVFISKANAVGGKSSVVRGKQHRRCFSSCAA